MAAADEGTRGATGSTDTTGATGATGAAGPELPGPRTTGGAGPCNDIESLNPNRTESFSAALVDGQTFAVGASRAVLGRTSPTRTAPATHRGFASPSKARATTPEPRPSPQPTPPARPKAQIDCGKVGARAGLIAGPGHPCWAREVPGGWSRASRRAV
ncbi:hypothetical protein DRB96_17975 [Streptomyces sp. ICC1]|nr:hypothetical protein DRB89_32010 [Streptomyces sp. ICC4]AWZ13871.1 hypothetical protein DRB96_17975 [Streptomyces sp. ICC1]